MKTTKRYSIIIILGLIGYGLGSVFGQAENEVHKNIEITYPEDWNLESTREIEMSVSPDHKAVIKKIVTRYSDLETAVDNVLNDYLKKDFTSLKKVNFEEEEGDGLNRVLINYKAVSKADRKPVSLMTQLVVLSDKENSPVVLFIGVIKTTGGKKLQNLVSESLNSLQVRDEGEETAETDDEAPVSITPKILPETVKETPTASPMTPSTKPNTSATKCSDSPLTEAEVSLILKEHNEARAEVGVPPLEWDCRLADLAQNWADQGILKHSSRERFSETFPDVPFGENLEWETATNKPPGVKSWIDERPFWDNDNAACQTGKVCGHYTQIVWRNTTHVGCGINRNTPGRFKTFFVCNYSPGGNFPGPAY